MSSASIQKLLCRIYSALKCSFDEFVGEKVVSLSYSSAILGPSPHLLGFEIAQLEFHPYLFCLFFCLLYFFLPPFEDTGLLSWEPDVLSQHSEVVLWDLLSV